MMRPSSAIADQKCVVCLSVCLLCHKQPDSGPLLEPARCVCLVHPAWPSPAKPPRSVCLSLSRRRRQPPPEEDSTVGQSGAGGGAPGICLPATRAAGPRGLRRGAGGHAVGAARPTDRQTEPDRRRIAAGQAAEHRRARQDVRGAQVGGAACLLVGVNTECPSPLSVWFLHLSVHLPLAAHAHPPEFSLFECLACPSAVCPSFCRSGCLTAP
jgi:hypothetical protein